MNTSYTRINGFSLLENGKGIVLDANVIIPWTEDTTEEDKQSFIDSYNKLKGEWVDCDSGEVKDSSLAVVQMFGLVTEDEVDLLDKMVESAKVSVDE